VTALANKRLSYRETWKFRQFTLASGNIAYPNGMATLDLSTGKVEPGHPETDLFVIGHFADHQPVDATSAEKLVNIDLGREIEIDWFGNDSNSIAATDVGSLCYIKDDQTVTITPTGASIAGRIWAVDSVKGVAVEFLASLPSATASLDSLAAAKTTLTAFSSNNINLGASPNSGAIYDVPTTAAASTITLPATAGDGTILYFVADGTKNGHTVQYRDATGPANLTTALTASKRHMVIAAYLNGIWNANAYVSP
jgi:hypothetical protein